MTSKEDCAKWLLGTGYCDSKDSILDNYLAELLHEFSKTTIGHFPAEEEKQKGSL